MRPPRLAALNYSAREGSVPGQNSLPGPLHAWEALLDTGRRPPVSLVEEGQQEQGKGGLRWPLTLGCSAPWPKGCEHQTNATTRALLQTQNSNTQPGLYGAFAGSTSLAVALSNYQF